MEFKLPNIYTSKNLKFFAAIPIVLMIISVYLSQNLILDTSLSGGSTITLQSNTTMSPQQIAGLVQSKIHAESVTAQSSQGVIQITLTANKSLSTAYGYLINFYAYNSNYSVFFLNQTVLQQAIKNQPNNETMMALLANATEGVNRSLIGMTTNYNLEIGSLRPLLSGSSYPSATPQQMASSAQNAYGNATNIFSNMTVQSIRSVIPASTYSYQQITVQQSSYFLQQLQSIIIIAFVLISIVVFIIFRSLIPSLAVIFGAGNDIIVALGAMAVFRIPLGIASIGGLLMLLGYSIDTDVLTAIRILKRHEGTPEERAYSSMKTGLTMTITAIVSFGVLFIVSFIAYVPTYYEIAGVVLFGLIGDLMTTWLGNASMILWYIKRRERR